MPGLPHAMAGLPIAVMTVTLMLGAMCGVLVVGIAVDFTYLFGHTHGTSLMVMMREEAQQKQYGYGQEHAICGTGFLHAAKLAIYSCKLVAFTYLMYPKPVRHNTKAQSTGRRDCPGDETPRFVLVDKDTHRKGNVLP